MQKSRVTYVFVLKLGKFGHQDGLKVAFGHTKIQDFGLAPSELETIPKITTNYLLARPLLETDNFHELDLVQPSKVVYLH